MKNIVLIIDWQNTYFMNTRDKKYMEQAVEKTSLLADEAREHGDQVVWIALTFEQDPDLFDDAYDEYGNLANLGSFHPKLIDAHQDNDPLFLKTRSDGFTGINPSSGETLSAWLSQQDFDQLIFTGYHIGDCVNATLQSALRASHGSKVVLARDACGDGPRPTFSYADMFNQTHILYGGHVCSAARVMRSLQTRQPVDQSIKFLENSGKVRGDKKACSLKDAAFEMANPSYVLDLYFINKKYKRDAYNDPVIAKGATDHFMEMWSRVNNLDFEEVKQAAETGDLKFYNRVAAKLDEQSRPTKPPQI